MDRPLACLLAALLLAPGAAAAASGFCDGQKVLNAVAEGKAAKASLKASFDRRQAAIDAAKAAYQKLEATDDLSDPDERARELRRERDKLGAFFKKQQEELLAEEAAATNGILERVKAVAEEVRVAKGLEALVVTSPQQPKASGEDLTGEVVRAYDAKHPVAAGP